MHLLMRILLTCVLLLSASLGMGRPDRDVAAIQVSDGSTQAELSAVPIEVPREQIRPVPAGWAPSLVRTPVFQWKAPHTAPMDAIPAPDAETGRSPLWRRVLVTEYPRHRQAALGALLPYFATAPPLQG